MCTLLLKGYKHINFPQISTSDNLRYHPKLNAMSNIHGPVNHQKAGQSRKKKWDRPCFCLLLREFTLLAAGYCIESGKWTYIRCWEWKISWKKSLKFIVLYNSCRPMQWRRDKGVILNKFSIFVWRFSLCIIPSIYVLEDRGKWKENYFTQKHGIIYEYIDAIAARKCLWAVFPKRALCQVWREGRNGECVPALQVLTLSSIRWQGRACQGRCPQSQLPNVLPSGPVAGWEGAQCLEI